VAESAILRAAGSGEDALERAFLRRPRISIRVRLAAAFLLLFLLMCGITASAVVFVSYTRDRLLFLDKASSYLFEVEQARRFEKNYFLYGTNLADAVSSAHEAEVVLERSASELGEVLGTDRLAAMRANLVEYSSKLGELPKLGASTEVPAELESRLRRAGARALADAEEMVDRERLEMHGMLRTSSATAVGFLVAMSLLMAFIVAFLTRSLLAPLNRFVAYTDRIGAGDYTPIKPARPFRDEFSDLGLAVNHMLRELKLRQEELLQAAKLAGVGTLTAGIAHELNNPLNNISLTTETLADDYDRLADEEKLRMLDQIATQVERASATVRNLLDFTRQERPVQAPVAVAEVVRKAVRLVDNELSLGHVELSLRLPEELPSVRGDARNLQQVFVNLCLNGIQAMPEGGRLEVEASAAEDGSVRVDVRDDGIGIPPENLDRVFDPFFTTKEPGEGTGLGLAVSYGIVREHHGRITVSSQVGVGTTFSVFLPASGAPLHHRTTEGHG
jgi:two-component system NtrC family sensor kinase